MLDVARVSRKPAPSGTAGFAFLALLIVLIAVGAIGAAVIAGSTATASDQLRVVNAEEYLEDLTADGSGIDLFQDDIDNKMPAALTHLSRVITTADRDICGRSYTPGDADEWSGRYSARVFSTAGTPIQIGVIKDTLELEVVGGTHRAIIRIASVMEGDARRLDGRVDNGDGMSTGTVRWTTPAADGTVTVRWVIEMPQGCNAAPTASFDVSCAQLACNFTSTSSDADGTLTSYSWNFGDASTSTAPNPSRTYAAGGTYTVTLTVTDDGGKQGVASTDVTVRNIVLDGDGRRQGQNRFADMTWSGALTANVDVYRDNVLQGVTPNDGVQTFTLPGAGQYTFRICEEDTSLCSNNVLIQVN